MEDRPKHPPLAADMSHWQPISDSTSVAEVHSFAQANTLLSDDRLVEEVEDFLREPGSADAAAATAQAEQGYEILSRYLPEVTKAEAKAQAVFALHAIRLGKLLNKLKPIVKASGQRWEVWAEGKFPDLKPSTRQSYMQLAEREDAHVYYVLGKDRLMRLLVATANMAGPNRIGDFMAKYDIKPDHEYPEEHKAFVAEVEAGIGMERLEAAGVTGAKKKLVRAIVSCRGELDGPFLKKLQARIGAGEDVNSILLKVASNGGKWPSEPRHVERHDDLNHISTRLTETIGYVLVNEDLWARVDVGCLKAAEAAIQALLAEVGKEVG